MKERPILFSSPMVRAILAGTKTQTRRVVFTPQAARKDHADRGCWDATGYDVVYGADLWREPWKAESVASLMRCPYGAPGDRLWVRETWKPWPNTAGPELRGPDDMGAIYAATWDKSGGHGWKPSIHMPRWASRIALEVTGVRVERVQGISEADARAEGIHPLEIYSPRERRGQRDYRGAFALLWDGINGKRPGCAWKDSPWVWVIEFRKVEL